MKSKIYTIEEQKLLLKNPFVLGIAYDRFIIYDPVFKLWCVLKRITDSSETSRHLFDVAGFPVELMSHKLPQSRIKSWEDTYFRYGSKYFLVEELGAYLKSDLVKYRSQIRLNNKLIMDKVFQEVEDMLEIIHENS